MEDTYEKKKNENVMRNKKHEILRDQTIVPLLIIFSGEIPLGIILS